MIRGIALLALAVTACGGTGGGVLLVTVGATGRVPSVASLRVSVSNAGVMATPVTVPLRGGAADIPPARTLTLSFSPDRSGNVHVNVDALGSDGRTIASAGADSTITPGQDTMATVTLPGIDLPDMGVDMTAHDAALDAGVRDGAFDAAGRDSESDAAARSPDMTTLPAVYTVRGATSGLGAGRSTGGAFVLSGSIGIPQPRIASNGGNFTLIPLVPGR